MAGKTLFKDLFIYFISLLAVVGLHCCTRAFSSCSEWALLFFVVCGLLIAVPSLIAEHAGHGRHAGCSGFCTLASVAVAIGLQSIGSVVVARGLGNSVAWGNLPGPEIKLVSLALQGEFLTAGPPRKLGNTLL